MTDVIGAKVKDKPQERRQGLGLDRKKRSFSLKTSSSQPPVNLEPSLDDDQLQDPDAFFEAYANFENAEKEIQRYLGGSMDTSNQENLSTRVRGRRPSILGKSYSIRHRYSIPSPEKVGSLMSSVEELEGTNSAGEDGNDGQDKIINPDPDLYGDLVEAELPMSTEKAETEATDILDELVSGNDEELDGEGALNILQDHLKIKPLDMGNLFIPGSQGYVRSSILSSEKLEYIRTSLAIDNVLKNVNISPADPKIPLSSPTSPRNMFASMSSFLKKNTLSPADPKAPSSSRSPISNMFTSISAMLKKRILESNSPKDPFAPLDSDFTECQNTSSTEPIDKLQQQVDTEANLSMSRQSNSQSEVEITKQTHTMGEQKAMGSEGNLGDDQMVEETACTQTGNAENKENEVLEITKHTHNMGEQKSIGSESNLDDQMVEETACTQTGNAENKEDEVPDPNNQETIITQERMDIDNWNSSSVIQNLVPDYPSTRETKQPTVHQDKIRKQASKKRTRNPHPMRKSIAEAGTSFENGVRRSKRIKTRPLEYWKGERVLYGRLGDSGVKLLGVRCFSPGDRNGDLKVKPYIPLPELPKYKELLDVAARL